METESDNAISFLDVLVIRKVTTMVTQVYRKPTHTGKVQCVIHHRQNRIRSLHYMFQRIIVIFLSDRFLLRSCQYVHYIRVVSNDRKFLELENN
jgi:hypothetical protein